MRNHIAGARQLEKICRINTFYSFPFFGCPTEPFIWPNFRTQSYAPPASILLTLTPSTCWLFSWAVSALILTNCIGPTAIPHHHRVAIESIFDRCKKPSCVVSVDAVHHRITFPGILGSYTVLPSVIILAHAARCKPVQMKNMCLASRDRIIQCVYS